MDIFDVDCVVFNCPHVAKYTQEQLSCNRTGEGGTLVTAMRCVICDAEFECSFGNESKGGTMRQHFCSTGHEIAEFVVDGTSANKWWCFVCEGYVSADVSLLQKRDEEIREAFLAGVDDGEPVYAEDWLAEVGYPSAGTQLRITVSRTHQLPLRIAFPDCSSWSIPSLCVSMESYGHAGFSGTVSELLEKTVADTERMRSGYGKEAQPLFDAFFNDVHRVLSGLALKNEEVHPLIIRDPSGLATIDTEDVACVERSVVERSFEEEDELKVPYLANEATVETEQINTVEGVADLIQRSSRIVALTGAGISVESGIPPFRNSDVKEGEGPQALWTEFDASQMTVQNFNTKTEVQMEWWKMKRSLMSKIREAAPNSAHMFLAFLQKIGKLQCVVTQNIDSLHQRSGLKMKDVIELHGHMRGVICSNNKTDLNPILYSGEESEICDFALSEKEAIPLFASDGDPIPKCPKCHAPLRTETVFFGQPMPEEPLVRARKAAASADLLIVIGTSLIVKPANQLPAATLRHGGKLGIFSLHDTQYDEYAATVVREPAGAFFSRVTNLLSLSSQQ